MSGNNSLNLGVGQGLGQPMPTSQQEMDIQHAKKQAYLQAEKAGACMQKRDASPIEMAVHELNARLGNLHNLLGELRARLEPVSSSQGCGAMVHKEAGADPSARPKAPLESQLHTIALGVQSASGQISGILDYLHI